jgi:hypothetical protein
VKPHEYEERVLTIKLTFYVHVPGRSEERWKSVITEENFEPGFPKYVGKVLSTIHVPSFLGSVDTEQESEKDFYVIPNTI